MYRIIIILVLLIVLFFMVRKAFREFWGPKKGDPALPAKDVMVQDPVCKAYIAAGNAMVEKIGGQTYFFCGSDCAFKFKNYMSG